MRNARCVATGDPPFSINSSATKARCSPDHAMVYNENGTYTAVRRRAPYHCTRSPPEAMPLPNRGVLSAGPCISFDGENISFDASLFMYINNTNIPSNFDYK